MTWLNSETESGMNSSPMISPADQRNVGPGPGGGELAEIVVGGDRVGARAELLDHVLHGRDHLLLADRPGAEGVGVGDAAFVLVGVEIELLELVDDRADRLALGAGESGHQHVDLVLLDQAAGELLPERVVALPVEREELELAAEHALLAGIDQDLVILVIDEIGAVLGTAVVDEVEGRALLADRPAACRRPAHRPQEAGADIGCPLQRLALVDLLHRELRRVQLLQAVDREIAALVLDEAELHRPGALRPNGLGEAEVAQIGGGAAAEAGDQTGRSGSSLEHAPAVGGRAGRLRTDGRVDRRLLVLGHATLPRPFGHASFAATLPAAGPAAATRRTANSSTVVRWRMLSLRRMR